MLALTDDDGLTERETLGEIEGLAEGETEGLTDSD